MSRPKGLPKTGGKPATRRTYTCALPECGKEFEAVPSDKIHEHAFCCASHASRFTNRAQGHQPAIEAPCGCGCGQIVRRYASQMAKNSKTAVLYVNRDHFNAARRAFQDSRRGKKWDTGASDTPKK